MLVRSKKFFAAFFSFLAVFVTLWPGLLRHSDIPVAEAAQVTIDSNASTVGTSHIMSGSQTVFIDDQTGYKFFVDAPGYCVYRKTTDGGASWTGTTTVDSQTDCLAISVWYDQWTPGISSSSSIHIATLDANPDDVWYNRLDTNGDILLMGSTPVSVSTAQGGTIVAGANQVSITRGTDGTIYTSSIDASDSYVMECSVNCNLAGSWSETGTNPFGLTNNYAILAPLPGGDIIAIHRDVSATAENIESKVWHNGAGNWDAASTTIDSNALDNTTYDVGMAFTVSTTTGDIYLAYVASNTTPGADDQIRTAKYSGGAWTRMDDVVRYTEKGITNVAIALDPRSEDVYVAYSARRTPGTAATANIYWRKSVDGMESWTYEFGPINTSATDIYGLNLNISSEERLYATWFDAVAFDILGETLVDIFPGIHVTTLPFPEMNSPDSYTQNTIDANVSAAGTSHIMSGKQTVFVSDQVGYKFFRDVPGYCVYSKTTNGGTSWGATSSVDAQLDCHQVTVWYDQWTPGITASSGIHIVTADASADDLWYNRLDTSSDTLLMGSAPVSMTTAQGGSLTEAENYVSVSRGTDGTLYAVSNDGTTGPDSFIVECTSVCSVAGRWTETGTNPLDSASDFNLLMPLSGGNMMLINRDISADLIRYKTWNNSAWSTTWTSIGGSATENATYDVGMAAAVSSSTGNIYLAYIANNVALGTDDEIRTAYYSGSAWATTTKVATSTAVGLTSVAIALDFATDDVYVAYSAAATPATLTTANVLWKRSADNMTTWGYEQGPVNATPDDVYGVDLSLSTDGRMYATWFDNTDDDILGATIFDLPGTSSPTVASQITTTYASTTDVYMGGVFALYNTDDLTAYDITGITLTENGTIDASTDISNVRLYYEMDTSVPYDCGSETYGGAESQFGSTDANGFSGEDGNSGFTGSTVSVSTVSTLCIYPVMDVRDSAQSSSTINILITNPASDVTVTGATAGPTVIQDIASSTLVYNDESTLTHYHWRNDDGTEITATSKTSGVEDTALASMRQGSTTRLRVEVSNEGSSSTPAMQYRLEYASNPGTCDVATGWTDVGDAGGDFDMVASTNLTEGANTTNIATTTGGVTDSNPTFLTPNAGVKETSSQTANITLTQTEFVELEYSIVASTTAVEGNTYCFRVTDQGTSLFAYDQLPRANIAADVLVTVATSSQVATTTIPGTNIHVGSAFVITENIGTRSVTDITIAESGTVDASLGLDNIRLKYEFDTTNPYNCAGESYDGSELQFGATNTSSFSGANGTSTFTGSVSISTTSTMCVYTVLDVTSSAQNGEIINVLMENPSLNLVVTGGGSVSPTIDRDLNGSTTLLGAVLTQTHYHWRTDNGSEVTASSSSSGNPDTAITYVAETTPVRLRMQVSNEGTVTSASTTLRIEYGAKITTCSAVSSWTDVGAVGGAWDMYDSSNLTDGANTTDIATTSGGFTNENTSFKTPNSAVKDTSSTVATTTLSSTEFIEAEFSMRQTTAAGYDVPYCFRLTNDGVALNTYTRYAELTTSPERDFEIQRNTATIPAGATSTVLVAGVHYTAPSASTSAFIRITNVGLTGAGHTTGVATAQSATNTTAYILNPANIMSSITIARTGVSSSTRVSWEIVEFVGVPGSDNEMIVRSQTSLVYISTSTGATGTVASGVVNDADVVVFITGLQNPDTAATNYESMLTTSAWNAGLDQPVFQRNATGSDAVRVSYAVVEFTGPNWIVQRSEHTYTAAGTAETEAIAVVGSVSRTFLHTQKRNRAGLNGTDEFGAEVWLSSIGFVSYMLQSGATTPSGQTSVAWIIENIQTSSGAMDVTQTNYSTSGGTAPLTGSFSNGKTLTDLTNASIFVTARSSVADTTHPRAVAGVTIASTTAYEIWRSNTGSVLTFRTEIVEWPTAGLALHQEHYQFFSDNNALTPTEPWYAPDFGEDTTITAANDPLGESERVRIRMSVQSVNATLPAGTKAFKLQYGQLDTTCSAISATNWKTLGDSASSTIWRGYDATGTTDGTQLSGDPPTGGDLKLSRSDVAGTLEEINNADVNAYAVPENDEIEYDWIVEQNGANAETDYCFRMVEVDGTPLDVYSNYPQIRTASFTPRTQNWRWYDDELSITPTVSLALENAAPVDIADLQGLKLRLTVAEIKNISRDDVRFKLQYSEDADFSSAHDVVSTSSCYATATWCYTDGGGVDNAIIASSTLTDAESCLAGVGNGCGTHNESPDVLTGYRHEASVAAEYDFAIVGAAPRVNRVYYFRLYDVVQDVPVLVHDGESYPSVVTEGSSLNFTMEGIDAATVLEGVTIDVDTTPAIINFGTLLPNTAVEAAHRLIVDTNGTDGYQLFMTMTSNLMNYNGAPIPGILGTNDVPVGWNAGCPSSLTGCFGYHTSDDTLQGGSTRFSAIDTYARVSTTTLDEISYSSQPVSIEVTDVIFRVLGRILQDAGSYEAKIHYVSVPIF